MQLATQKSQWAQKRQNSPQSLLSLAKGLGRNHPAGQNFQTVRALLQPNTTGKTMALTTSAKATQGFGDFHSPS